jgi:hypothetical protein
MVKYPVFPTLPVCLSFKVFHVLDVLKGILVRESLIRLVGKLSHSQQAIVQEGAHST